MPHHHHELPNGLTLIGAYEPSARTRLLANMLRPALRGEDFDLEKHVTLEAIALYQDRPRFQAYDRARATYWHRAPGQSREI